jgi:hypothetical protein
MDNLDALCRNCHTGPKGWEYQKHEGGEYWNFKVAQLGAEKFEELRQLSMKIKSASPRKEATA